jgi:hypothetical protein
MVRLDAQDDDDETGYYNQATVNMSEYSATAPADLVQLSKNDPNGG